MMSIKKAHEDQQPRGIKLRNVLTSPGRPWNKVLQKENDEHLPLPGKPLMKSIKIQVTTVTNNSTK